MSDVDDNWDEIDRTLPRNRDESGEEESHDHEDFFKAGRLLLKRGKDKEAMLAFKQALMQKSNEPRYMSYFGLTLAKVGGKVREGLVLCEKASQKEFFRAELFLNLGRVYLIAGNRRKAHMAFRKGLSLNRDNAEIKRELKVMGVRRPPVFPFLDRRNSVNVLAGRVLHRLRLR